MKAYLYIKPEASHMTKELADGLHSLSEKYPEIVPPIEDGIKTVKGELKDHNQKLLEVRSGIMSDQLFERLYPNHASQKNMDEYRRRVVDNTYTLIFFEVPDMIDNRPSYEVLQELKGKMAGSSNGEGTGLRGFLRSSYERTMPLNRGTNFIHIPDSEQEALQVYDYYSEHKNEGSVVFQRTLEGSPDYMKV
jgi:hypothetical protein